jgi:transcription initiation factor TFIID subunit 7
MDDLIVVDDVDDNLSAAEDDHPDNYVPPSASNAPLGRAGPATRRRVSAAQGGGLNNTASVAQGGINSKSKAQPKLKLKLSEKAAAQVAGMSFLGAYDRELDSDEEDLVFEEQFILRMPPGEDCDRLRRVVTSREVGGDVWFKFKGAQVIPFSLSRS